MVATVAPIAVFPVLMVLLFGGGAGLPLGVPPLPEDPLLARVAPPECLVYLSVSGTAAPDAKSANQTEQLLAEPEIQRALSEIERVVTAKIGESAPPQQAAMTRDALRWGKKLLTRPVAVFVSSVAIGPQGPDVRGGVVINVGEDAAELKTALEGYQALLPGGAEKVEIAGMACYRLKMGPGAPAVTWGIKGKYLLAGVGEGSLEGILERARGSVPEWLTAIGKQLPVQRRSTVMYVNVKKIREQFAPMGGPQVLTAIAATGLDKVTSLTAVTGLDGEGMVSRTLIGTEGEPTGVLSLADKPLEARDLAAIPRDANLAVAVRLDAARVLETALAIAGKIEPHAPAQVEAGLQQITAQLGVDLRKDVLASLGDVWCVYNSSDEGGLILTGLTAVVQVKDYERLSAAHAKLLAAAKAALARNDGPPVKPTLKPPAKKPVRPKASQEEDLAAQELQEESVYTPRQFSRPRPRIAQLHFAGQDIYFLSGGDGMPFAPAWCLTQKELIVAPFPQQIKAYLSRGADFKSLATAPEVVQWLRPGEDPIALCYFDARKLLDFLYPMLCMGFQGASGELAREGINLDVSIVPSAPAIYKHLRPGTTVLRRTPGGIELISRGTVPGGSLTATAPVAVGLLLPAVQASRQAARRAVSQNNLHQISLAMIMYESKNGRFPPAFIADKKTGKPLLSWRVAILPYIEEGPLYEQFHLDEPWDSEHNKKLAETFVRVYRSPVSQTALNMTNYLTVRGKDTAFPGKDAIGFPDITGGASHTIMVVEVSDAKAVVWTKPDDFAYDEKQPAAGILGLWPNGFNAAFCDGSVRFLRSTIDAETLRRMFNRNNDKPVDMNKF